MKSVTMRNGNAIARGSVHVLATAVMLLVVAPVAVLAQAPSWSNRAPAGTTPGGETAESLACPCVDGLPESEPNCGLPDDTVNGGCNSMPNVFSTITPGDTYCGTAEWDTTVPDFRDTDWYEYTVLNTQTLVWKVEAEFPAVLGIIDGSSCAGAEFIAFDVVTGCGDVGGVRLTLTPGTYWFFVAPDFFGPPVACGAQYTASLLLGPEPAPAVSAAGLVGTAIMLALSGSGSVYLRRRRARTVVDTSRSAAC